MEPINAHSTLDAATAAAAMTATASGVRAAWASKASAMLRSRGKSADVGADVADAEWQHDVEPEGDTRDTDQSPAMVPRTRSANACREAGVDRSIS